MMEPPVDVLDVPVPVLEVVGIVEPPVGVGGEIVDPELDVDDVITTGGPTIGLLADEVLGGALGPVLGVDWLVTIITLETLEEPLVE